MLDKEAIIVLHRGGQERHIEILRQALRAVTDSGKSSICLTPVGTRIPEHLADFVHWYETEKDDVSRLAEYVNQEHVELSVSHVIALAEQDVQRAALLRKALKLPGLTPQEAVCFRDKNAMAATAAEEGLRVADSCQPHSLQTVEDFATQVGFPIIVKPFDGVSCTNTYKVKSTSELKCLWPIIEERRHDYRVEAFVHGRQFHVDCVLRDGEVLFEVVSEYTATILDQIGVGPMGSIAHVDAEEPAHLEMLEQNLRIVRRFGLSTGIVHTEFYLKDDGTVVFGETAARTPGGYIPMLYEAAFGMELIYTWVRTEIDPRYHWPAGSGRPSTAESLWTGTAGSIEAITSRDELMRLEGVHDVKLWKRPGDVIEPVEGSRSQEIGFITVTGSSVSEAKLGMERARRAFAVTCI